MPELVNGFKDAQYDMVPTKFIIDPYCGIDLLPIKERFPCAKLYIPWSPATTYLYAMLGELPNHTGDTKGSKGEGCSS